MNSMNNTKDGFGTAGDDNSWKTDIPESCLLTFMKGNKIADLDKKFVLLSHPYPIIEGEMIVFQPFDQDQYDEQLIIYRDFSLRKRYPTSVVNSKKLTSFQQKQIEKDDEEKSKLNSLEIDLFTPLSQIDWKCMGDLVEEVQGIAWVQILPVHEKASQPQQYQLMHILPNSKIPFASLTLDIMISAKSALMKKLQAEGGEEIHQQTTLPPKRGQPVPEPALDTKGVFTLEELKFPHAVIIHDSGLKQETLIQEYRKCFTYLKLDHHPEVGLTLIVTPKWMFVAPLVQAYTVYQGLPVYLDAYAYLGIVNIQVVEKEWPATAGLIDRVQLLPTEVLEKSSNYKVAEE